MPEVSLRAVTSEAERESILPGALIELTPTQARLSGGVQTDAMADSVVAQAKHFFPDLDIDDQQRVDPSFPPLGPLTLRLSAPDLFGYNSSSINEAYVPIIDQLAAGMSGETVSVLGYTDDSGPAAGNLRLSEGRAATAADRLISQGVPSQQVTSAGRGEDDPIATNDTEEGRLANRRVEFVVSD